MSARLEPVASAQPAEALSDESRRRSPPRPESGNQPGSDTEEVPTLVAEEAAGAAATHLATEPLIPLEHEAPAGRLRAQQLVAKYANEQAAEDADARELVAHHVNDSTAERRLIAERANADVADRRVAAERANIETRGLIALLERDTEDRAARRDVAVGADDVDPGKVVDRRLEADPAERHVVAERAADDAAADKAAAARTEAAAGEALDVTA